jgi:hypothetical protein
VATKLLLSSMKFIHLQVVGLTSSGQQLDWHSNKQETKT